MVPIQKLLIVVDMQNDFVTGALGSQAAADIIEKIAQKIEALRAQGAAGILFTADTHTEGDYDGEQLSQESARIPKHCIAQSEGWQIVPALKRYTTQENIINKPTFLSPTLAAEIRDRYGEEIEIELCGVCTDICVVSNALALRGAFPRSPITVDSACCAGTTPENHEAALAVMRSCLIEVV